MPATLLCARFTDQERTLRTQARTAARHTVPDPAAATRALALAICEVEAGLRSASQLERICHPSPWDASPTASSGPAGHRSAAPASCASRPRNSARAWWMRWRWSAGVRERYSSPCGWRPCRAAGSSSSSSTCSDAGRSRRGQRAQDSPRRLSTAHRARPRRGWRGPLRSLA
jgi:hypothetical protein